MAITQLTILPVLLPSSTTTATDTSTEKPSPPPLPDTLLTALHRVTSTQKTPVYIYRQIENPSIIYLLGPRWSSSTVAAELEMHREVLLKALKEGGVELDVVDGKGVEVLFLDMDDDDDENDDNNNNNNEGEGNEGRGIGKIPLHAPVLSINRHFIKPGPGQRAGFATCFKRVKPLLETYTSPHPVSGGFSLLGGKFVEDDKERKEKEGKEEFVLFSGFESVERHMGFAATEAFEQYKEIVEWVEGFEVKHGVRVAA